MMSKFEMALLTVTVAGTLVAWTALPQDSSGRPTGGPTDVACSARSSAVRDLGPSAREERASLDQASRSVRMLRQPAAMP